MNCLTIYGKWHDLMWCVFVYCLQQEFFDCLCSLIDASSDNEDDRLVDAAESIVLNGQFCLAVVFCICRRSLSLVH